MLLRIFIRYLLLVLAIIGLQGNAPTEAQGVPENLLWLRQERVQYAADGSAYSEVTLMKGEQPLQLGALEVQEALITKQIRRGYRGTSHGQVKTEGGRSYLLVETPTGASCEVYLRLRDKQIYHTLQTKFSIYGDSWNKEEQLAALTDKLKRQEPYFQIGNGRYSFISTGFPIKGAYKKTEDGSYPASIGLFYEEQTKLKQLLLNRSGGFSFTLPLAESLSRLYRQEDKYIILMATEGEEGTIYKTTMTLKCNDNYYAYNRVKEGFYLLGGLCLILTVGVILYQRRRSNYEYL